MYRSFASLNRETTFFFAQEDAGITAMDSGRQPLQASLFSSRLVEKSQTVAGNGRN
jgi:hypothetical protein